MSILNLNELSTLSIDVNEEIESKNLNTFLRTSIKKSNLSTSKDSSYSFYYNPKTLTYEIIVYREFINGIIPEPFLLINKYMIEDNKIKVLLVDTYFIIIKNSALLILKKINKVEIEEISLYIQQVYKINNFEIIEVKEDFSSSLNEEDETIEMSFVYPLYPKKSFYFFLIFIALVSLVLIIFIYMDSMQSHKSSIPKTSVPSSPIRIENNHTMAKFITLFSYINLKNIQIEKVLYLNNQLQTTLLHKNKRYLLEFVNEYNKNIYLKYLKYDTTKGLYKLDIYIEY